DVPVPDGLSVEQAVARLRTDPNVLSAEPDYFVHAAVIPNDPRFPSQSALRNTGQGSGAVPGADISATKAWDVTTGSMKTVAPSTNPGPDNRHADLYQNIWINQGEIPAAVRARLIDTDGDGLITFRDLNDPRNQGVGKITDLNHNGRIDGGDLLFPYK